MLEVLAAALAGVVAGLVGGRWVWLRWVPAARAYLHSRWVAAVRAAVQKLPPGDREALLGSHPETAWPVVPEPEDDEP